jgi:ketosteroid isomerase-like protein
MTDHERAGIVSAVEARMRTFEAAERALDAEALIAHFVPGGGFYLHNDGERVSYHSVTGLVRNAFPTLRSIDGGFQAVDILVLAPDAALATATFRETITQNDGEVVRQRGAVSWLWRYLDGEWRLTYGHVDHYPE